MTSARDGDRDVPVGRRRSDAELVNNAIDLRSCATCCVIPTVRWVVQHFRPAGATACHDPVLQVDACVPLAARASGRNRCRGSRSRCSSRNVDAEQTPEPTPRWARFLDGARRAASSRHIAVAARRRPVGTPRRPHRDGAVRARRRTTAGRRRTDLCGDPRATASGEPRGASDHAVDRRRGGARARQSYEAVLDAATRRARSVRRRVATGRSCRRSASRSAAAPARHRSIRGPRRRIGVARCMAGRSGSGQPRVVSVFGETGTGTATLLRQLESEVRLRGGLFAIGRRRQTRAATSRTERGSALLRATHRLSDAPRARMARAATPRAGRSGSARQQRAPTEASTACSASCRNTFARLPPNVRSSSCSTRCSAPTRTSWDALEHLVSQIDTDRLMICLSHQGPDSAVTTTAPHRRCSAVVRSHARSCVSNLTRDEVKQWLEAAFHRQQVGREFLAFLYRHTEGNPLFIAQMLRALIEDGAHLAQRNAMGVEPGVGASAPRRAEAS